jgi:hypothetical protein
VTILQVSCYIQNLIGFLNNPANHFTQYPFASGVIPRQGVALTADSSVSRFTVSGFPLTLFNNYNFAVARVRLRGTAGPANTAQDTKVFFRLWSTQTADTGFDPNSTFKPCGGWKAPLPPARPGQPYHPIFRQRQHSESQRSQQPGIWNHRLQQPNHRDPIRNQGILFDKVTLFFGLVRGICG